MPIVKIFQNIYNGVTISARTVSKVSFFRQQREFYRLEKKKQYNNKYPNKWKKEKKNCIPFFTFLFLEGKWQKLQTSFFFFYWKANKIFFSMIYRVRGPVRTQRPYGDAFSIKKKLPRHKQDMKSRKQRHQKMKHLSPHNI